MQWKRGLWRLGWVLWAATAVPTVFIAYQESIEPDYQWKEMLAPLRWDAQGNPIQSPEKLTIEEFQSRYGQPYNTLKQITFSGASIAYVPEYFSDEQTEKALLALEKFIGLPLENIASLSPPKTYECTVQLKANRPKAGLYATLGLSLVFVLIQGGFRLALWVIAGFRNP